MTCIANATINPDEHGEIEVTPEMICAAARILLADPFLDLSVGWAEELAKRMLERALRSNFEIGQAEIQDD